MNKWTHTAILEHAINSLRSRGGWAGTVYDLTDRDDGLPVLRDVYNVDAVAVPPADSKLAIHSYKCKMFDHVAANVNRVLYMDADIIISTNLKPFLSSIVGLSGTSSAFEWRMKRCSTPRACASCLTRKGRGLLIMLIIKRVRAHRV